jgi:endoglucanase
VAGCGTSAHDAADASNAQSTWGASHLPAAESASQLSGWSFYVNKASSAAQAAATYESEGKATEAHLLSLIAARPTGTWITSDDALGQVDTTLEAAMAQGQQPIFVAYNMVGRDCGSYSAGGATSAADYESWVSSFASRIGNREAVVILEPDTIPQALTCATQTASTRYGLLSYAVTAFAKHPNTKVYIDAGNPSWITNTGSLASALRKSGIGEADGFSLNVSNFQTTDAATSYGTQLSRLVGGKHFVIDTGRNGNGPYTGGGLTWCNPPGRALGQSPTTSTDNDLVDAHLWVKPPGESDGTCGPGAPPAGTFWPKYATDLAKNAGWN